MCYSLALSFSIQGQMLLEVIGRYKVDLPYVSAADYSYRSGILRVCADGVLFVSRKCKITSLAFPVCKKNASKHTS